MLVASASPALCTPAYKKEEREGECGRIVKRGTEE
jgi:hypothetical protein